MTIDVRPYTAERRAPPAAESARLGWTRGIDRLADRLIGLEPWLAVPCALLLLAYPNPLVVPAGLVGIVPSVVRLARIGRPWRPTPFDLPLALLVLGALLGGLASLNRDGATIRLAGLLAGLLLFAAAREHVRTARQCRALVVGLLALAMIATIGLLVVVAPFLLLDHVPPLAGLVRALDRWEIGQLLADEDWLLQRYRLRASGVGAMADIGLVLIMAALVGAWSRRAWPPLGLLALFFVGALVASDNRGSMLAAVLVLGAVGAAWRRRLLILLPIGASILGATLALGLVEKGLRVRTIGQRFWFWENAAYLAHELPLTGAGLGLDSVRLTYQAYFLPVYPPFSHAHNIYLQGLLEQGIFGLLGLVGLAVATLRLGWRSDRRPERWVMAARLAGFGIALTMLTTGLSEITALSTFGGALLLGGAGLLAATATPQRAARPVLAVAAHPRRPFARPRARVAVVVGGLLVLVAATLALTGGASRLIAVALLNAGTAELNRGTVSEWVDKTERAEAVDRAARLLRAAADHDANDLAIQRNLSIALAARGDERAARAAADRARALVDPAAVTAQQDTFQVGRAYAALNSSGEAIRAWRAAEAGPQLLQLGNRLLRSRSYDQATNAFTAVTTVQPRSRGAYEGIGRAVRERGGTADDVVRALRPLVARGGEVEYMARLEMGRAYRDAGRLTEAFEVLREAERIDSGPELAFERGVTLALAERWNDVERSFERARDELSLEWESWYWLAYSLLRQGRADDALAVADEGFGQANLDRRADRVPLLTIRGEGLLALGRPTEALAAFEEGLTIRERDARLREGVERARAAMAGAERNLVTNPGFAWDGGWATEPKPRPGQPDALGDERPQVVDGTLRIAGAESSSRAAIQQIWGLEPGATYRLSVRARRDGGEPGIAVLGLMGQAQSAAAPAETSTAAPDWATIELTFRASDPIATIRLALSPETSSGTVLFDDVSLVRVSPAP